MNTTTKRDTDPRIEVMSVAPLLAPALMPIRAGATSGRGAADVRGP